MNKIKYKIFFKRRNGTIVTQYLFSDKPFDNIDMFLDKIIYSFNKENPKSYIKKFRVDKF